MAISNDNLPSWASCSLTQASNPFFDVNSECRNSESELASSIATEAVNQKGLRAGYYVVSLDVDIAQKNPIYKEDQQQKILRKFWCMIYSSEYISASDGIANLSGLVYQGNPEVIITFKHFASASTYQNNEPGIYDPLPCPRIGDIISIPNNGNYLMFEIVYVTNTNNQFEGRSIQWNMKLRLLVNRHYTIVNGPTIAEDDPIRKIYPDKVEELLPLKDIFDDTKEVNKRMENIAYENKKGETKKGPNKTDPFGGF